MANSSARLRDIASVIRSKNAGPFVLTLDIMFDDDDTYRQILTKDAINPRTIAQLYQVREEDIAIIPYPPARAIKVTFPRPVPAGDLKDTDIYGTQQHQPLLDLEIS